MKAASLSLSIAAALIGAALLTSALGGEDAPADSTEVLLDQGAGGTANPSPVQTFRKLLALSPAERTEFLTNFPPARREKILEKVQEYQLLPPPLGEMRLQVTELRWYLLPLLSMETTERETRLKSIPEPFQTLVAARLDEWNLLPPSLKSDVLEYEPMMHYLVGRGAVAQPQVGVSDLPPGERSALEQKLVIWQQLPAGQRQQMYASFERYLRLNEDEQERVLQALSEPERQRTEKALEPFEKWPKAQQEKYFAAFQQFAEMSTEERRRFINNAARWQRMSETERQAWRDLIGIISKSPPLPIGFVPPAQPGAGSRAAAQRTNPVAAPDK